MDIILGKPSDAPPVDVIDIRILLDKSTVQDLVAGELAVSGLNGTELSSSDVAYVAPSARSVLSGLETRRTWESHIGAILTHKQVLDVTGWTKQALSQAVSAASRCLDASAIAMFAPR